MPAPIHEEKTIDSVACAVLTVSDSRTAENDIGGGLIRELLLSSGHMVHSQSIVPDDPAQVRRMLEALRDDAGCAAVLITGGTGIASRDTTYEAVIELLDKRLDGFGELFRLLSYEEIGAAAMLSRAVAGVMGGTAVFAMPGSPAAVRLAMEKLILPELGHIACLLAQ